MTRVWKDGSPIEVQRSGRDTDDPPARFRWLGAMHRIERIVQHTQVDTDWWTDAGAVSQERFAVITNTGMLCVIYLDLNSRKWFLHKLYD